MKATTKPVEVECIQWTGDNTKKVSDFGGGDSALKLMSKGEYLVKRGDNDFMVMTEVLFHATYDIEPKESEWKNGDYVNWINPDRKLCECEHQFIGKAPNGKPVICHILSGNVFETYWPCIKKPTPPVTESE